ncbi:hypothetical protein P8891_13490 [Bacillus atrophaeus]|uniref:hypothetical protein n=1 Tax=Bacillus atrophaeus TaxID=1452 RepID=UPI00227EC9F1|nr:hypothetical protein [Bacillus atrophaeus]MCY7947343.1 hypothetical protein [Bacillus atrophaeus]MCY8098363.1 hypothetical protein [Bacillus atrophaeus]MCY9168107.1 hypothetical protein [Bacillus atrophaeus]MEC0742047.1 hypothetical protein [Bacillus atrophaeus]MEC0744639.1 hypothetical protein [Bacillus atrophaeus]
MNMSNSVSPQITNIWPEDEKSRDFISLLTKNGTLFIFPKDVKDNRGDKIEIIERTKPITGKVLMKFTQNGTDYCIQWCRASEKEIIEIRQRELKRMEETV